MKIRSLLIVCYLLLTTWSQAQTPGTWTWMHGDNFTGSAGSYGTYRVAAPTNKPPAKYEAAFWTDLNGNFWMFGGVQNLGVSSDLWKFDVASLEWTWMHGPSIVNQPPVYGTLGVPAPGNTPGARGFGSYAWTGQDGNLWLFGGAGYSAAPSVGALGDLWKFDVVTLEWTWMHGSSGVAPGSYGALGVPSPSNMPPGRHESTAAWVSNSGELWLYGGMYGPMGDLWRYSPATNMWTWMKGSALTGEAPVYGTMGTEAPANTPGARWVYGEWRDKSGQFYVMGGVPAGERNDLWRFNPVTNNWAWIGGASTSFDPGYHGAPCSTSSSNWPSSRRENGTQWVDSCGGFWQYGGVIVGMPDIMLSDFWYYHPASSQFTYISGSSTVTVAPTYGTLGTSSPLNTPGGRGGACAWMDLSGRLWMFGGFVSGPTMRNDMWVYVPDAACIPSIPAPVVTFSVDTDSACAGTFSFNDSITGGISLAWDFGDGTGSALPDPSHTYSSPGTYIVTLVVYSSCGDSTEVSATVYFPTGPVLPADTTFCGAAALTLDAGAGYSSYLWSTGDLTSSISVSSAGIYSVTVSEGGCVFSDSIIVTEIPFPVVDAGPDTTLCDVSSYVLSAGSCAGCIYAWNTGDTTSAITVSSSGVYSVTVTAGSLSCAASDTISLTFVPGFSLGPDVAFCEGGTSVLSVPSGYTSYSWNTGASTPAVSVTTTGTYSVTVTQDICIFSDSALVTVFSLPAPDLGPDIAQCDTIPVTLSAAISYPVYLWSTGEITDSVVISSSGIVWVQVTDSNGCTGADTLLLSFNPGPYPLPDLGPDLVLCGDHNHTIGHTQACPGCVFVWNTGDTTATITVQQAGVFALTITNDCGSGTDSLEVTAVQSDGIILSNVFSPNGDGINDYFNITVLTPEEFELTIVDRWGKGVWHTENPAQLWDGSFAGSRAPDGVYFYHLRAKACNGENRHYTGAVTLVR